MDKHEFDEAIGAAPPSGVDVDAIVARQRRVTAIRRVAAPTVVAAAAVVAVTFGVALALPNSGGDVAPVGGPGTQAATSPPTAAHPTGAPVEPACDTPPDAPAIGDTAARLTIAARAAFQAHAPGVALSESRGGAWPDGQLGPLQFGHVADPTACLFPDGYLIAYATGSDAAGSGDLLVVVQRGGVDTGCADPAAAPEQTYCRVEQGPGGEVAVVTTLVLSEGSVTHRVDVTKPDGTSVTAQSSNAPRLQAPTRAAPHLTHEQLVAIALDPAMTLSLPG